MSARVCSPPAMMDLTRDMMTPACPTSQPLSSSSYPGTTTQSSTHLFGRLSSSFSADSVNRCCRSVSRNLFGTPEGSSQYARQKLQEIREADSKRWNFDFDKEKPLDGRYQWEAIGSLRPTHTHVNEGPSSSSSASEIPTNVYTCSGLSFLSSAPPPVSSSTSTSAVNLTVTDVFPRDSLLLVRPVDISSLVASTIDLIEPIQQETIVSASERSSVSPSSIESLTSDPVPEEPHSPVLVESSVESSEDDAIVPSMLRTDSSPIKVRMKSKQTKMTEFMSVKKRRGGPARTTAGKKASL